MSFSDGRQRKSSPLILMKGGCPYTLVSQHRFPVCCCQWKTLEIAWPFVEQSDYLEKAAFHKYRKTMNSSKEKPSVRKIYALDWQRAALRTLIEHDPTVRSKTTRTTPSKKTQDKELSEDDLAKHDIFEFDEERFVPLSSNIADHGQGFGPVVVETYQNKANWDLVSSKSQSFNVANEQNAASISIGTRNLSAGDSTILQKSNVTTGRQSQKDVSAHEYSLSGLTSTPHKDDQKSRKKGFADVGKCDPPAATVPELPDTGAVQQSRATNVCIASKSDKSVVADSPNRFLTLQRAKLFYPPAFHRRLVIPNDTVIGLSDVSGTQSCEEENLGIIKSRLQTHTNSSTVVHKFSVTESVPQQRKRQCRIVSRPPKRSAPRHSEGMSLIAVEETSFREKSNSQTMANDSVTQVSSTVIGVLAKPICNPEIPSIPLAMPKLKVLDISCSGIAEQELVSDDVTVEVLHKSTTVSESTGQKRQSSSILKYVNETSSMQAISPGRIMQTSCERSKYEMNADNDGVADAGRGLIAVDTMDYSLSETSPVSAPDHSVPDTRQIVNPKTTAEAVVTFDFVQVVDESLTCQIYESPLHEKANNLITEKISELEMSTIIKKQCGPLTRNSINSPSVDVVVAVPKKINKLSRIVSYPRKRHPPQSTLNGALDGAPGNATAPISLAAISEIDFEKNDLVSRSVISMAKPLHQENVISKQQQSKEDFELEAHDVLDVGGSVEYTNRYHTTVTEENKSTALNAVVSEFSAAPTSEFSRRVSSGHSATTAGNYELTKNPKECSADLFECSEHESPLDHTKTTAAESISLNVCKAIKETNVCAITQPQRDLSTGVMAVDELTILEVLQIQAASSTLQVKSSIVDLMPAQKRRQVIYESCLQVPDLDVLAISVVQAVGVETPLKRKKSTISSAKSPDSIVLDTVKETCTTAKQPDVSISPVSRHVMVRKKLCTTSLPLATFTMTDSESVTFAMRDMSSDLSILASGLVVDAGLEYNSGLLEHQVPDLRKKVPKVSLVNSPDSIVLNTVKEAFIPGKQATFDISPVSQNLRVSKELCPTEKSMAAQFETKIGERVVTLRPDKPCDLRSELSDLPCVGLPRDVQPQPCNSLSEIQETSRRLEKMREEQIEVQRQSTVVPSRSKDITNEPREVPSELIDKSMELSDEYSDMCRKPDDVRKSEENTNQFHGFGRRKYKVIKRRRVGLRESRLLAQELFASDEQNVASEIDPGHKASGTTIAASVCDHENVSRYARSYDSIHSGESLLKIIKLPVSRKPNDYSATTKVSVMPESAEKQILNPAVRSQELPQQLDMLRGVADITESTSVVEQPRYSAPKISAAHQIVDLLPFDAIRNSCSDTDSVDEELHADVTRVSHSGTNESETTRNTCMEVVQESFDSDSDDGGLIDVVGDARNEGSWEEPGSISLILILSSSECEDGSPKIETSTEINGITSTHHLIPSSYCTPGQVNHDISSTLSQVHVVNGAIPIKRKRLSGKVMSDIAVGKKSYWVSTDASLQRGDVEHRTFLRPVKRDAAEPTKYPVMRECKVRLIRMEITSKVEERQKLKHWAQQEETANCYPTLISSKKSSEETAIQVKKYHTIEERESRGADSEEKTVRKSKHPKGYTYRLPAISEYSNYGNVRRKSGSEDIERSNGNRASVSAVPQTFLGVKLPQRRCKANMLNTTEKHANLSCLRKAIHIVTSHLSSESAIIVPPWPSRQTEIPSLFRENTPSSTISKEEKSTLRSNFNCFSTKRAISECECSDAEFGNDITTKIDLNNVETDQISEVMNCAEKKEQGNEAKADRIKRFHPPKKSVYQENCISEVSKNDESVRTCETTPSTVSEVTSSGSIPLVIHQSSELKDPLPYSLSALTTHANSREGSLIPISDITGTPVSVVGSQTLSTDNNDNALTPRLQIVKEIAGQSHIAIVDLATLLEQESGDIRQLLRDIIASKTVVPLQLCMKASVQQDQEVNTSKDSIVFSNTTVEDEHNASSTLPVIKLDTSRIYQELETSIVTLGLEHDIPDMTSDLELSSPSKTTETIIYAPSIVAQIENNMMFSNKTPVAAKELTNKISTETEDCEVVELQHISSANVVDITIVQERNVPPSIKPSELELRERSESNNAEQHVLHYSSILETGFSQSTAASQFPCKSKDLSEKRAFQEATVITAHRSDTYRKLGSRKQRDTSPTSENYFAIDLSESLSMMRTPAAALDSDYVRKEEQTQGSADATDQKMARKTQPGRMTTRSERVGGAQLTKNKCVGIADVLLQASSMQSLRTGRKTIDATSTGLYFGEISKEIVNEKTGVSMVVNVELIETDKTGYADADNDQSPYRLVQDHSLGTPAGVDVGGKCHETSIIISDEDDSNSTRDSCVFADTAVHNALLSWVSAIASGRKDNKTTSGPFMGSEDSELTPVSQRNKYERNEVGVMHLDKLLNGSNMNSQLTNIQGNDVNGKYDSDDGIVPSSILPAAACNDQFAPRSTIGGNFAVRTITENGIVNIGSTDFNNTLGIKALRDECASVIEDEVSEEQEIIIPLVEPFDASNNVRSKSTQNIDIKHSLTKPLHTDNAAVPHCLRDNSVQASPPVVCGHTSRNVDIAASSECVQCRITVDSKTITASEHLQQTTDQAMNIESGCHGDVVEGSNTSRSMRLSSSVKVVFTKEPKAGADDICVESGDESTWNMDNDDWASPGDSSYEFSSIFSDTNDSKADVTDSFKPMRLSKHTGHDDELSQFNRASVNIDNKVQSWMSQDDCSVSRAAQSSEVMNHNSRKAPCAFCGRVIVVGNIYDHFEKCECRTAYYRKLTGEDMKSAIREYGESLRADESGLHELMEVLRDGDVKDVVLTDNLTRRFAGRLMESLCSKADRKAGDVGEVSRKVRLLGRLIIAAREKMPDISLDELIRPGKFDLVVHCVRFMMTHKNTPLRTLSKKFGCLLRELARAKEGMGVRDNDEGTATSARQFLLLLDGEWYFRVDYLANKKYHAWKRTKPRTIPVTEDLVKLRNYVLSELKKAMEQLRANQEPEDWAALARLTVVRLLTFNKRRTAEVTSLKVVQYLKRPKWHKDARGELAHVLTPQEQAVAQRMDMVVTIGKSKKNFEAFVLLPPDSRHAIDLLVGMRECVGILPSNPYVFALLSSNKPMSGYLQMQSVLKSCGGFRHPERINSHGLRRYIATVTQIIGISDSDTGLLAHHLGHDVDVHKKNYRISHFALQLSKVSQMLVAADNGRLNEFKAHMNIRGKDLPSVRGESSGKHRELDATFRPTDAQAYLHISDSSDSESPKVTKASDELATGIQPRTDGQTVKYVSPSGDDKLVKKSKVSDSEGGETSDEEVMIEDKPTDDRMYRVFIDLVDSDGSMASNGADRVNISDDCDSISSTNFGSCDELQADDTLAPADGWRYQEYAIMTPPGSVSDLEDETVKTGMVEGCLDEYEAERTLQDDGGRRCTVDVGSIPYRCVNSFSEDAAASAAEPAIAEYSPVICEVVASDERNTAKRTAQEQERVCSGTANVSPLSTSNDYVNAVMRSTEVDMDECDIEMIAEREFKQLVFFSAANLDRSFDSATHINGDDNVVLAGALRYSTVDVAAGFDGRGVGNKVIFEHKPVLGQHSCLAISAAIPLESSTATSGRDSLEGLNMNDSSSSSILELVENGDGCNAEKIYPESLELECPTLANVTPELVEIGDVCNSEKMYPESLELECPTLAKVTPELVEIDDGCNSERMAPESLELECPTLAKVTPELVKIGDVCNAEKMAPESLELECPALSSVTPELFEIGDVCNAERMAPESLELECPTVANVTPELFEIGDVCNSERMAPESLELECPTLANVTPELVEIDDVCNAERMAPESLELECPTVANVTPELVEIDDGCNSERMAPESLELECPTLAKVTPELVEIGDVCNAERTAPESLELECPTLSSVTPELVEIGDVCNSERMSPEISNSNVQHSPT